MKNDVTTYVYVGCGGFDAEPGMIAVYALDRDAYALRPLGAHPAGGLASFLAIDQQRARLFAADEKNGGVISFSIDSATGALTERGVTASRQQPVYLTISPGGKQLLAANYNQGSVEVYPISETGIAGSGTHVQSTGSQAHCVVQGDDGRVFVANKGADTISGFRVAGSELVPLPTPSTAFASPRHIFLASSKAYVIAEDRDTLAAFDVDDDGAFILDWVRARSQSGLGKGADVQLTPSGRYLYATNRDPENTIVAFDVSGDEPHYLGHAATCGNTPRNFAIDPLEQVVIVANHGDSKSLAIFAIEADGRLTHRHTLFTDFSPFFVCMVRF